MDHWINGKFGRLVGGFFAAALAWISTRAGFDFGLFDASNNMHIRGQVAVTFWAAIVGLVMPPPSGFMVSAVTMLIGGALLLLVGAIEGTVSFVLHGLRWPDFPISEVAPLFVFPAVFAYYGPKFAFIDMPKSSVSVVKAVASSPMLSLVVSISTILATMMAAWPNMIPSLIATLSTTK